MSEVSRLSAAVAALVRVSAAIATRDAARVVGALGSAGEAADPSAVDEIILQSHLFVGFPDALRAMASWREMSPATPLPTRDDEAEWEDRGERVCRAVYAGQYGPLRARMSRLHPDLDRWMVVGGYGRVIGRPPVDLVTRELCTVALLAVWEAPDQLHSHLRGAVHAGASLEEVRAALVIAAEYASGPSVDAVWRLWSTVEERFAAKRGGRPG